MEQIPPAPNPITWNDFSYIQHNAFPDLPVRSDKISCFCLYFVLNYGCRTVAFFYYSMDMRSLFYLTIIYQIQ